jgi:hypothetical protein
MWQRKHYPDTVERLARLRAAQAQLDRLDRLFGKWSGGLLADKNGAIAAAERSAELAATALKPGLPKPAGEPDWDVANAS